MSVAMAAFLLVLIALVVLAAASFFRHSLTALAVLVAIPVGLVLQALIGIGSAVAVMGLLVVAGAVLHTIGETLRLLRAAKRTDRRVPPVIAERSASTRRSDRSRIAA
jgi:ABC-type multidrug transport system fused ATPase/permease subunit